MVTHDRYFLDRVCSEIIEIDNQQVYSYKGNYSYYLEKRQERIEATNAEIARANNLYRTELEWMRRMPQARGHKARYREEAFYELEKVAKQRFNDGNVKLDMKASYIGSKIFEADHLYKRFGDLKITEDFNYIFARYEKMGIVGNNGTGKSTFIKMLTMFSNPLAGILVGILFTAVLQSASATVGVLQALSVTGLLTFASAFPIVLGIGVGAACPVLISAIGANKNGKRTALVYLLNDLFGLIMWSVIFYTANAFVHFTFTDMVMTPVSIALLNTVFRVATVVVLFPFIPKLEKLVCILVKDSAEELEDEADFDLLEERLLNYPALAIAQCHRAMNGMAKKLRKNVNRAMNLLNEYQQDKFDKVQRKEDLIDKYESRLGEYLIQLTKREMNTVQTRQVSLYLHTIGDFERIGDHASYIAHMSNEMHDNHTDFSPAAWNELNIVMEAVREEINITCNAFLNDDKEAAQRVAPLGVVITHLCDELKMHHVERLSNGNCGLEEGTVFNDILNSFGRIASHCASAMVALMKSGEQDPDMHIRDSKIYPTDSFEYYTYFSEYKKKYDITDKSEEHVLSMEPEEIE